MIVKVQKISSGLLRQLNLLNIYFQNLTATLHFKTKYQIVILVQFYKIYMFLQFLGQTHKTASLCTCYYKTTQIAIAWFCDSNLNFSNMTSTISMPCCRVPNWFYQDLHYQNLSNLFQIHSTYQTSVCDKHVSVTVTVFLIFTSYNLVKEKVSSSILRFSFLPSRFWILYISILGSVSSIILCSSSYLRHGAKLYCLLAQQRL